MPSPAWFFSTVAQAMATIIAFIISLIAVLHQLRYDRKKRRIEDFKKQLAEFDQKYSNSTDDVMTVLKEFYDDSVPYKVPEPEKISSDLVGSELNEGIKENPVSNAVWLHIYNINRVLSTISSREDIERGQMPEEDNITEIKESIDYISGKISKGDSTMADEMETFVDSEELSVKKNIFDNDDTRYRGLESWFSRHFPNYDNKHYPNGQNILSLVNYFEQMEKDADELMASYKAVDSISKGGFSESLNYIITITFIGVFIPIISLLTVPNEFVLLSGWPLTIYQGILITVLAVLIYYLLKSISDYLPLKY